MKIIKLALIITLPVLKSIKKIKDNWLENISRSGNW